MNTSSLAHTFTVSQVEKVYGASTFTNVIKRRESILYRNTVPNSAANISYVVSEKITPQRNLSIADRSTALEANRITNVTSRTESGIESFTISTENFVVTDIFTDETETIAALPLFYKHVISHTHLPRGVGDALAAGVVSRPRRLTTAMGTSTTIYCQNSLRQTSIHCITFSTLWMTMEIFRPILIC
jgi:hypothetical protein